VSGSVEVGQKSTGRFKDSMMKLWEDDNYGGTEGR
jgi:hypothetical protein